MVQAKVLKLTGGNVTIRPHMIEGGGSSEAWYGAKNLRCRGSDTFSRLWNFMARWYNWRATAQTLRTDVSRAKYGGEGGIRTHGPRKGTAVFETARFGRSRTSPASILR